jgi:hypothetical protein
VTEPTKARRRLRPLRIAGAGVLIPVAVYGAALSYESLYQAAHKVFTQPLYGHDLALGLPLVVDLLILGASLIYVDGARNGQPGAGWRLTAHAAVVTTLILNAIAARTPAEIPWHVVAPAVWSVLVELTAREMLQEWRASQAKPAGKIPARLWLTAPIESLRTWLRMARRLEGEQAAARLDIGLQDAAIIALTTTMAPHGRDGRRTRRTLIRLMRRGVLHPHTVLTPLGWTDTTSATDSGDTATITPSTLLKATLAQALTPAIPAIPEDQPAPRNRRRAERAPRTGAPDPQPLPAPGHTEPGDDPTPGDDPARPLRGPKVIDLRASRQAATPDPTVGQEDPAAVRLQVAIDLVRNEDPEAPVTWGTVKAKLAELGIEVSPRTASRDLTRARAKLAADGTGDLDDTLEEVDDTLEEAGAR